MYETRIYTLNSGVYCGECDRDGVRNNVNPDNGCVATRERMGGSGGLPDDERPVV
jgi:hypothetical protein